MKLARHRRTGVALAAALLFGLPIAAQAPTRLSDEEFWRLHLAMSEPGGSFRSDNFTSNETNFPGIAAALIETKRAGGAYVGVGPEQNFHYIAAIRPQFVFLIDIRRQAVIQHLMYKAIFEMSATRADFLSLLFSKPRVQGLDTASTIDDLLGAYASVRPDSVTFARNVAAISDHLTKAHRFALLGGDRESLDYVYGAFYQLGPDISYAGYSTQRSATTFATLAVRRDAMGAARSFLGSEESFRFIKSMHEKNLILPVVGDFGGPTALRAIGDQLRRYGLTVTAFYVSNVEQYLFSPNNTWREFYDNVATLPVNSASAFIRPSGMMGPRPMIVIDNVIVNATGAGRAVMTGQSLSTNADTVGNGLCPIGAFIDAFRAGRVLIYSDATRCVR